MTYEPGVMSIILFVLGAMVGSFLNVVIYRLPKGESIVFPSSHCPHCQSPIRFYDNIPILGYLLLRGRCRDCKMPISIQYPLVELVTGLLFVVTVLMTGVHLYTPLLILWVCSLVVIFVIDLQHYIIPDWITLPGVIVGLLYGALSHHLASSVIGMLAGFLFFYSIAWISLLILKKEGMGGGDIKLAAMLGAWLGWQSLIVALFISFLIGAILGLIFLRFLKDRLFPFGTALALGGIVALFTGEKLLSWYLGVL